MTVSVCVCVSLTAGCVARSGPGASDLLSLAVHTPALAQAAVALHGLIGSVRVAGGDILSHGGPRAEEEVAPGVGRGAHGPLSVSLTGCLLTL